MERLMFHRTPTFQPPRAGLAPALLFVGSETAGLQLSGRWGRDFRNGVFSQGRIAMLVLSRKIGEKVVIGDGIVVVVKRILGQRVTFGIEAPQSVRIVRGELPRFDEPPQEKVSRPQLRTELWPARPR